MGEQLGLDELLQAAERRRAQGSGVQEGEDLHGVRRLVPLHLPLQDLEELGLGDSVDLQGAVFGQKGAEAEVGGVKVGVVLADHLLELASALRGAKDGLRRAAEEVAGVMGEGVREGLTREGREVEVLVYILEVSIGALGPLRTTDDQWGGLCAVLGTPPLHHLVQ